MASASVPWGHVGKAASARRMQQAAELFEIRYEGNIVKPQDLVLREVMHVDFHWVRPERSQRSRS